MYTCKKLPTFLPIMFVAMLFTFSAVYAVASSPISNGTGSAAYANATPTFCYGIENLTQYALINFSLNGTKFGIRVNFITPNTTGVTVNNWTSTLQLGRMQFVENTSNEVYLTELYNVSYIPIGHTVVLKFCSAPVPTSTTSATTSASTSSTTTALATTLQSTIIPPPPTTTQPATRQSVPGGPMLSIAGITLPAALVAKVILVAALILLILDIILTLWKRKKAERVVVR